MGFEKICHWEKPAQSAAIFGSVLATLISICYFSLISVVAYASLTLLLTVVALKLYVYVMVTFLKKETVNPVAQFSQCSWVIPSEKVQNLATTGTENVNSALTELRRLFLVENMVDSIKFGISLWLLTYIGSWFNAMTIVILSWVGLFTVPKVYINNKAAIDPILEKVKAQYKEISDKVGAMLPQGKIAPEVKKEE